MRSPGEMPGLSFLAATCVDACQKGRRHLGSARLDRIDEPIARAGVAQLVRALVCGTRGRWFKSTRLYHPRKSSKQKRRRLMRRRFVFLSIQRLAPAVAAIVARR